jgi:hypothetical protein
VRFLCFIARHRGAPSARIILAPPLTVWFRVLVRLYRAVQPRVRLGELTSVGPGDLPVTTTVTKFA